MTFQLPSMRRVRLKRLLVFCAAALVVSAVGLSVLAMLLVSFMTKSQNTDVAAPGEGYASCIDGNVAAASLSSEQNQNARTIIGVGLAHGITSKGLVIAIATALQESTLRNLPYGDRDSLGLFQQRPGSGWGSPAQILDPALSTEAFFGFANHTNNPGLLDIAGWQDLPITVAAQRVQRSAFPNAYAYQATQAIAIVSALTKGKAVATCAQLDASTGGDWQLPLARDSFTYTSAFGMRLHPTLGYWRLHAGADLGAPSGVRVSSAAAGVVQFAGQQSGYGNIVVINHGDGVETAYAHLSAITVPIGTQVKAGTMIGRVGQSGGISTGPHLHFEVRRAGTAINPIPWMNQHGVDLATGAEIRSVGQGD